MVMLWLGVPGALGTLLCQSRDNALAMVRTSIRQDAALRKLAEGLSDADLDDLVTRRLHLVRAAAAAVSGVANATTTATTHTVDIRSQFWPPEWRADGPPVAYVTSDTNAAVAAASVDCSRLLAATVAQARRPPTELVTIMYAMLVHEVFISERRVCDEQNEVAVYDPDSGMYVCACAGGDAMCSSSSIDRILLGTALGLVCAVVLVLGGISVYMSLQVRPRVSRTSRTDFGDSGDTLL